MIQQLINNTKNYLDYFLNKLDQASINQLVEKLVASNGTIFFTGVGKSGLIAKKIAMTLSSTGTHSLYLSAMNALHGDLGIVYEGDTVLLLSKSGETEELLHLCPALRNKGVYLIAVVSNQNSRLSKACDSTILLPVSKELCPFDLAPTTSAVVQLIFGDILAVALMQTKKFTVDDYAKNHPAGRIGRRLTFKVQDLMLKGPALPTCNPQDKVMNILVELSNKRCGCVLIVDSSFNLEGIFTDGDLRRALQKHGPKALEMPVKELMTHSPKYITAGMLAIEAMRIMEEDQKHAITVLPVLEDNRLIGLVKLHDLVQSGI